MIWTCCSARRWLTDRPSTTCAWPNRPSRRRVKPTASGGVFLEVGSRKRPFSLWLPDADGAEALRMLRLIGTRYLADGVRYGRGYVYVSGVLSAYRDAPQLELKTLSQLSDVPPGA